MTKQDFITWATARGWERDRFGHLHKGTHRFKLSSVAVRYEVKNEYGWVRLRSNYLGRLTVNGDGLLAGLTREGCLGFAPAPKPARDEAATGQTSLWEGGAA